MERKRAIQELDKLFSRRIRARDGSCQRCHRTENLQAAHIFSRSRLSVRWDATNAITLCAGCHLYWAHKYPLDFYDWIEYRMGKEAFARLRHKSNFIVKMSTKELNLLCLQLKAETYDSPAKYVELHLPVLEPTSDATDATTT